MSDDNSIKNKDGLSEKLVKGALTNLDWNALKVHFESIDLTQDQFSEVCGHVRRYTDFICKYPRPAFEKRRAVFLDELRTYAAARFGVEAETDIAGNINLLRLVEHGYRSLLGVLAKCPISKRPPAVRVAATVSRAGYQYLDLMSRHNAALGASQELNLLSGLRLQDDDGKSFSADAVLDMLSETIAMTIIMEAYKNDWFKTEAEIVVLPELPNVGEEERFQAGATEVLAAFWRQWQRVEKRRRYLEGELRVLTGPDRPAYLPAPLETAIEYLPPEDGLSAREVYDDIAHSRLKDRLVQTFVEMEVEHRISDNSAGIAGGAALPPGQYVSAEELHAAVSLSEILGYAIVDDTERPGGLRLIEWVRGYAVLQEIAQTRTEKDSPTGDDYALVLSEAELTELLQACGLEEHLAPHFIAQASLHKSSRDMFDCPLVRLADSRYLLFGPAAIHMNIALAILSNLSNRGEELGRKGKAFEHAMREVFRKHDLNVFAFEVHRDGQPYESAFPVCGRPPPRKVFCSALIRSLAPICPACLRART